MKRLIPFLVTLLLSFYLNAQQITVTKIQKLELNHLSYFPKFGNNSNVLLLSGPQYKGLSIYNIASRVEIPVTQSNGAGNNPHMNSDGSVLFNQVNIVKGKRQIIRKKYTNGSIKTNNEAPANLLRLVVDGKYIRIFEGSAEVKTLNPNHDAYYLWASFSPNQKQILYTAAGKGTFIANLDGEIIHELGYLNAPKWLNNKWVIGMSDKDDGNQITESSIVAVDLGHNQYFNLTREMDSIIAIYPEPSPNGDRIVFHSPQGYTYLLDVLIHE